MWLSPKRILRSKHHKSSESGVPDIFSIWEDAGYVEPTIEEHFGSNEPNEPDKTIIILPLVDKGTVSPVLQKGAKKGAKAEEIQKRVALVYQAICANPKVKNTELESIVGASKRQIENAIKILKQEGKIHRDKENRKGKWIITE